MIKGYVLIVDLLGYGEIIKNLSDNEIDARVKEWLGLIDGLVRDYQGFKYALLSDTLFVTTQDNEDALKSLIIFSRRLLEKSLEKSLPLRGAISYGLFNWENSLVYGKAIIEAHELESNQEWIGILINSKVPHVPQLYSIENVVCYPVPFKNSPVILYPAICWDIPNFEGLVQATAKGGLHKNGQIINHKYMQLIRNTIEFRLYLQIIRGKSKQSGDVEPSKFNGLSPIHVIEKNLKI